MMLCQRVELPTVLVMLRMPRRELGELVPEEGDVADERPVR